MKRKALLLTVVLVLISAGGCAGTAQARREQGVQVAYAAYNEAASDLIAARQVGLIDDRQYWVCEAIRSRAFEALQAWDAAVMAGGAAPMAEARFRSELAKLTRKVPEVPVDE